VSRFVLDCSVTMAWCFGSEADAYTQSVLASMPRDGALVPAVWLLEVPNVLLVAERRRRITRGDADRFLALLEELPVEVAASPGVPGMAAVTSLGRAFGLSAYDAAYIHLARHERLPLATRDRALETAAGRAGVRRYEAR
jgi:predicted nucleic acid-binding protein